MATTQQILADWFETGKQKGATHMIVVCDMWDYSDYPVYVYAHEDVRKREAEIEKGVFNRVMEVYNLAMDRQTQLDQNRSRNY